MAESVTNELILRNLNEMHRKIDDFREETRVKLNVVDDKISAMREHIGAQQFDIASIYTRLDYFSDQIERIKAHLPARPAEH